MEQVKDILRKEYNLIDMDEIFLGKDQKQQFKLGLDKTIKTIFYTEENIEFFKNKDIQELKDMKVSNDSICVLAHGINEKFPFKFINHYDFWIRLKKLNSNTQVINHDMVKPLDFLFLSRRETELRGELRNKLIEKNCLGNSIISYVRGSDRGVIMKNLEKQYEHPAFHDTNFKANNYHHPPAIWQVIPQQFANTKYSIVAETIETNNVHCMSEKIFKPIIAGHIFIVLAGAGYLDYLRQNGFKTFHDYIDESYDRETDPIKRVDKIVLCCQDLASRNHIELYKQVANITKHNRQLFFSDEHLQNLNINIIEQVREHFRK